MVSKRNPELTFTNGDRLSLNIYQSWWNVLGFMLDHYSKNEPERFNTLVKLITQIVEGKRVCGRELIFGLENHFINHGNYQPRSVVVRFLKAVVYKGSDGKWYTGSHHEVITNFSELIQKEEIRKRFNRISEAKPLFLSEESPA